MVETQEMFTIVKDTFNKFDKDGCGKLKFAEYSAYWKSLGQPGSTDDIRAAFDAIDVNGCGYVEFPAFVYSIMGEEAYSIMGEEALKMDFEDAKNTSTAGETNVNTISNVSIGLDLCIFTFFFPKFFTPPMVKSQTL